MYNRSAIRFMPCGTNQIKGQRSRGQRFNGSPKLNVRAQVICTRLIPAMSSIETSLLNSVYYIISLILETSISHFWGDHFHVPNLFSWSFSCSNRGNFFATSYGSFF